MSLPEVVHGFLGDGPMNGGVVGLVGHGSEHLGLPDHSEDRRGHCTVCGDARELAVVEAPAPAESAASRIDRGGGHEDEIHDRSAPNNRGSLRLRDPERARSKIARNVQCPLERSVGERAGEQDVDTRRMSPREKSCGVGLPTHPNEARDTGGTDPGRNRDEVLGDPAASCARVRIGRLVGATPRGAARLNLPSQLLLLQHNASIAPEREGDARRYGDLWGCGIGLPS